MSLGEYKTMLFGGSKTCHLGTKHMSFTDTLQCCILHLSESVTVQRPFKTFILLYSTLLRSRVCTVVDLALAVTSESPDTHFTGRTCGGWPACADESGTDLTCVCRWETGSCEAGGNLSDVWGHTCRPPPRNQGNRSCSRAPSPSRVYKHRAKKKVYITWVITLLQNWGCRAHSGRAPDSSSSCRGSIHPLLFFKLMIC